MKEKDYSIQSSCQYFGKSRQGYYDRIHCDIQRMQLRERVLCYVREIRTDLPKIGGRKLHYKLKRHGIKIGRDALFSILGEEGLLIKRKRKFVSTTDSRHNFPTYDNLIKDMEISHAEDVFVSDITYIHTDEGFCYLSIVGDAYTKKIMGKYVSRDLFAISTLKALVEALNNKKYKRDSIHHSDQGSQYCSRTYTNALKLSNIMISMAAKGKAYENPVAERMIGILKDEYGLDQKFRSIADAEKAMDQAIHSYNTERPHLSCGYLTPDEAHEKGKDLINMWKRKSYPHIHKKKKEKKKQKKKEEKLLLQL